MTRKRPLIAVFGSSTIFPESPTWRLALELGRALGEAGADVMTGGYSGAMEAVSQGAHETGAHVVGVTVELFESRGPVNRYVKERIHTALLFDRLRVMIERAEGFIAVPGSIGTLTEVFLTWNLLVVDGRPPAPLVLLGAHWNPWLEAQRHPDLILPHLFEWVRVTEDPREAARWALEPAPAARA